MYKQNYFSGFIGDFLVVQSIVISSIITNKNQSAKFRNSTIKISFRPSIHKIATPIVRLYKRIISFLKKSQNTVVWKYYFHTLSLLNLLCISCTLIWRVVLKSHSNQQSNRVVAIAPSPSPPPPPPQRDRRRYNTVNHKTKVCKIYFHVTRPFFFK